MTFEKLWPTLAIPGEFDNFDLVDRSRWYDIIKRAYDEGVLAGSQGSTTTPMPEYTADPPVMSHLNCSFILPGRSDPNSDKQWMRERTHGCWCSSWRVVDGKYTIWRDGRWQNPKPGELRKTKTHPPQPKVATFFLETDEAEIKIRADEPYSKLNIE